MIEILKNFLLYTEGAPMIFSTYMFWIFFTILMAGYCMVYKKIGLRNAYLLVFSLFFYYKIGGIFLGLLILSTAGDYCLANLIHKQQKEGLRKFYLTLSVILNLGFLSYFKYTYFFASILNEYLGLNLQVTDIFAVWSNSLFHTAFDPSVIILPVGISFYTFQSLSYTIDVYRREIEPVKNVFDYGFFVSFFPQLVAGPIVRATEFIPQIYQPYSLTRQDFSRSIYLILNGLVKKLLISDYISVNFVDRIFDNPKLYSGFENLMAVYGYAIQIYCDFSGYTDIAIGLALIMGFKLSLNFNSPYQATNITDFWRRWHISLSTWLKDYLYISLGGNRKGKFRTYFNLFMTMLLGGLWHGAAMRFVIWGALHGIGLVIHKLWMGIFPPQKGKKEALWSVLISGFITFHFVCFCWIFFRADNMSVIADMLHQIAFSFHPELVGEFIVAYKAIFVLMLIGYIIHFIPADFKAYIPQFFEKMPSPVTTIVIVVVIFLLYQFKTAEIQPFIYFQF